MQKAFRSLHIAGSASCTQQQKVAVFSKSFLKAIYQTADRSMAKCVLTCQEDANRKTKTSTRTLPSRHFSISSGILYRSLSSYIYMPCAGEPQDSQCRRVSASLFHRRKQNVLMKTPRSKMPASGVRTLEPISHLIHQKTRSHSEKSVEVYVRKWKSGVNIAHIPFTGQRG